MKNEPAIIYEDDDILAINKPAGLIVHGDGRTKEETLAEWILEKYPRLKNVGENVNKKDGRTIERPGIVHRIDRDTSGVLLVAKNQNIFTHIKKQFQKRAAEKIYEAIVYGRVKNKKGIINIPIGKSKKDFRQKLAHKNAVGTQREAITEYEVIKTGKEFSYVRIYPKTGRTHQIRAHMKAIGHPVMCDRLYAKGRVCAFGMTRMALHARQITVRMPNGNLLVAEAQLPSDFSAAVRVLENERE